MIFTFWIWRLTPVALHFGIYDHSVVVFQVRPRGVVLVVPQGHLGEVPGVLRLRDAPGERERRVVLELLLTKVGAVFVVLGLVQGDVILAELVVLVCVVGVDVGNLTGDRVAQEEVLQGRLTLPREILKSNFLYGIVQNQIIFIFFYWIPFEIVQNREACTVVGGIVPGRSALSSEVLH